MAVSIQRKTPGEDRALPQGPSDAETGQPAALALRGVTHVYGTGDRSVPALTDIDLSVSDGEFVTIVGPSGCGKSTLLRIVAGLEHPTAGQVQSHGKEVRGPSKSVGIVFQNAMLLPWRNTLKNVLLPAEIQAPRSQRRELGKKAEELLQLVGLAGFERALPAQLSGGMQQRVSLARALLLDPTILLMDEPFASLDAITREQMNLEVLRIWSEARTTAFFITHSVDEAVVLSDRIVIMTPRPGRVHMEVDVDLPRPRSFEMLSSPSGSRLAALVRSALRV
jgi:NitT/TauT family transport system ATP-binding protein